MYEYVIERKMTQDQLIIEAHILLNKIEQNVNFIVNSIKQSRVQHEDEQRFD